jgi:hypothetical protein
MMEEYLRLREIASNVACMVHGDAIGVVDGRASSIIVNKRNVKSEYLSWGIRILNLATRFVHSVSSRVCELILHKKWYAYN